MEQSQEFERFVEDVSLGLLGRIWGHGPVQAEGTVNGQKFHFRARFDAWSFAAARSSEIDPGDISFAEQGFLRESSYGQSGGYDASYISYDEVELIIKNCARAFLEDSNNYP